VSVVSEGRARGQYTHEKKGQGEEVEKEFFFPFGIVDDDLATLSFQPLSAHFLSPRVFAFLTASAVIAAAEASATRRDKARRMAFFVRARFFPSSQWKKEREREK
jgi:hypothetical protein